MWHGTLHDCPGIYGNHVPFNAWHSTTAVALVLELVCVSDVCGDDDIGGEVVKVHQ